MTLRTVKHLPRVPLLKRILTLGDICAGPEVRWKDKLRQPKCWTAHKTWHRKPASGKTHQKTGHKSQGLYLCMSQSSSSVNGQLQGHDNAPRSPLWSQWHSSSLISDSSLSGPLSRCLSLLPCTTDIYRSLIFPTRLWALWNSHLLSTCFAPSTVFGVFTYVTLM